MEDNQTLKPNVEETPVVQSSSATTISNLDTSKLLRALKITPALFESVMAEEEEDENTVPFEDTLMTIEDDGRYLELIDSVPPDVCVFMHLGDYIAKSCVGVLAHVAMWTKSLPSSNPSSHGEKDEKTIYVVESSRGMSMMTAVKLNLNNTDATSPPPSSHDELQNDDVAASSSHSSSAATTVTNDLSPFDIVDEKDAMSATSDNTNETAKPHHIRICVLADHISNPAMIPNPNTLQNLCSKLLLTQNLLISHQFYIPNTTSPAYIDGFTKFYNLHEVDFYQLVQSDILRLRQQLAEFTSSDEETEEVIVDATTATTDDEKPSVSQSLAQDVDTIENPLVSSSTSVESYQEDTSDDSVGSDNSSTNSNTSIDSDLEYQALVSKLTQLEEQLDIMGHLKLAAAIYAPVYITHSVLIAVKPLKKTPGHGRKTNNRISASVMPLIQHVCQQYPQTVVYFAESSPYFVFNDYRRAKPPFTPTVPAL